MISRGSLSAYVVRSFRVPLLLLTSASLAGASALLVGDEGSSRGSFSASRSGNLEPPLDPTTLRLVASRVPRMGITGVLGAAAGENLIPLPLPRAGRKANLGLAVGGLPLKENQQRLADSAK